MPIVGGGEVSEKKNVRDKQFRVCIFSVCLYLWRWGSHREGDLTKDHNHIASSDDAIAFYLI